MPFRLTNALITFQLYINRTIARLLNNFVIVYLDNILIYSKKGKDYKKHIRRVLERLYKHKLYTNKSKSKFSINKVEYLRFIITFKGVVANFTRVNTVT